MWINTLLFMAVGYLCAGSTVAILSSLDLWADFFQTTITTTATATIISFVVAVIVSFLILRQSIKIAGAKAVFEQDILIFMIGMLFLSLALNKGMLIIGLFVAFSGISVYFYENFKRQLSVVREGGLSILKLSCWAIGPIIAVIYIAYLKDYGLIATRFLYAHYIVIGFIVWTNRLSLHENYKDVPMAPLKLTKEEAEGIKRAKEAFKKAEERIESLQEEQKDNTNK